MQTIEAQLKAQKDRLLSACEAKVRAQEMLTEAENEIREARMGAATLDFALREIKKAAPATPIPDAAPAQAIVPEVSQSNDQAPIAGPAPESPPA